METARYRVAVDQDTCIGCGLCEETLPDVFTLGDYTASAIDEPVPGDESESLEIAARDCPVGAIALEPADSYDSGDSSGDDHQEGEDIEEGGEIREYKRKHGYPAERDDVQTNHAERL